VRPCKSLQYPYILSLIFFPVHISESRSGEVGTGAIQVKPGRIQRIQLQILAVACGDERGVLLAGVPRVGSGVASVLTAWPT